MRAESPRSANLEATSLLPRERAHILAICSVAAVVPHVHLRRCSKGNRFARAPRIAQLLLWLLGHVHAGRSAVPIRSLSKAMLYVGEAR